MLFFNCPYQNSPNHTKNIAFIQKKIVSGIFYYYHLQTASNGKEMINLGWIFSNSFLLKSIKKYFLFFSKNDDVSSYFLSAKIRIKFAETKPKNFKKRCIQSQWHTYLRIQQMIVIQPNKNVDINILNWPYIHISIWIFNNIMMRSLVDLLSVTYTNCTQAVSIVIVVVIVVVVIFFVFI